MSHEIVSKLIRTVSAVLAVILALIIPVVFGAMSYLDLQGATKDEARFHGQYLQAMIANGRLEFTSASLRDVIGSIAATSEGTSRVRIVYENGKVLLDWGAAIDTMSVSAASTVTFAGEVMGPYGVKSVEVMRVTAGPGGTTPAYQVIFTAHFESAAALQNALNAPRMGEVLADIPKYHDAEPDLWIGEVVPLPQTA